MLHLLDCLERSEVDLSSVRGGTFGSDMQIVALFDVNVIVGGCSDCVVGGGGGGRILVNGIDDVLPRLPRVHDRHRRPAHRRDLGRDARAVMQRPRAGRRRLL